MAEGKELLDSRWLSLTALSILGIIVAATASLALHTLQDFDTRLRLEENWTQKLQDTQNIHDWRIDQNASALLKLQDEVSHMQIQIELQQSDIASLRREVDEHQTWIQNRSK